MMLFIILFLIFVIFLIILAWHYDIKMLEDEILELTEKYENINENRFRSHIDLQLQSRRPEKEK